MSEEKCPVCGGPHGEVSAEQLEAERKVHEALVAVIEAELTAEVSRLKADRHLIKRALALQTKAGNELRKTRDGLWAAWQRLSDEYGLNLPYSDWIDRAEDAIMTHDLDALEDALNIERGGEHE